MKEIGTIEVNLSKAEIIEKLKAVTIPISIESINKEEHKKGPNWFKALLKLDINTVKEAYKRSLNEDALAKIEHPENAIFAGEVHNDGAKIYMPNQYRDLSFDPKYIEQLPAEIKTTINELEELQTKIINIPTYISATATIERLFYYDLQITDKKIEITKSKFKKEQDNKNWWGTTLIMSSTYRTFAVPVIVVSLSLSHFMSSDQWKLLCKFFLIPGFIVLVSYVLFVLPFQWTRLIAKLRSKSDELFVDLLLNILG